MKTPPDAPDSRNNRATARARLSVFRCWLVALMLTYAAVLSGCNKQADGQLNKQLRPLPTLPVLDVVPVQWTISNRARLLRTDASKALTKGDCVAAAALSVESVTLDPSLTEARLDLARIYAACGVPDTALGLLKQMAIATDHCAGCREAIVASRTDKTLAPLWKSTKGQKISKLIVDTKVPFETWATNVRDDLVRGRASALATLIHPDEPWQMIRSCPKCASEARQKAEAQQFFGFVVAEKLANRFTPDGVAHGAIPLIAVGPPSCSGRCCQWKVARPVAISSAALSMLCFRPITPRQGALTRLELIYGQPKSEAEAAKKKPDAPNGSDKRVVYLAAPATSSDR